MYTLVRDGIQIEVKPVAQNRGMVKRLVPSRRGDYMVCDEHVTFAWVDKDPARR